MSGDGVSLNSMAHPEGTGPVPDDVNSGSLVTKEMTKEEAMEWFSKRVLDRPSL